MKLLHFQDLIIVYAKKHAISFPIIKTSIKYIFAMFNRCFLSFFFPQGNRNAFTRYGFSNCSLSSGYRLGSIKTVLRHTYQSLMLFISSAADFLSCHCVIRSHHPLPPLFSLTFPVVLIYFQALLSSVNDQWMLIITFLMCFNPSIRRLLSLTSR